MDLSRGWVVAGGLLLGCVAGAALAESTPCGRLDAAAWLVGSWQAETEKSVITERWTVASPTTLEGRGITRARSDGSLRESEDLRLLAMGDGVFYLAKVAHNERPVAFQLTACDADRLVFENATHDFPRRIEYRRIDATHFEAHVSDGGDRGFHLDFRRQTADDDGAG